LLQTDPPFHPIPSARFLFFHAEEGLRYLFICQVRYIREHTHARLILKG
jgi:hypothetical protein